MFGRSLFREVRSVLLNYLQRRKISGDIAENLMHVSFSVQLLLEAFFYAVHAELHIYCRNWNVVWYAYFCVLCLIVVPLPPGRNPFALHLNNKTETKLRSLSPRANYTDRASAACRRSLWQLFRTDGATCQRDGSLRPYSRLSRP
jgi:hypothetical protein